MILSTFVATAPDGSATASTLHEWGMNTLVLDNCESPAVWLQNAQHQMAGFKALGANSVAVAFPIYTGSSQSSNDVHAGLQCAGKEHTPPAARIGVTVGAAHALGLKVMLRPLIDGASLTTKPGTWRGNVHPSSPKLWFKNYFAVLKPYLRLAKSMKVERFAISSELNSLARNPLWAGLIAQAHLVYPGNLSFAGLWSGSHGSVRWRGATSDIDMYISVVASPTATPDQLLAGWNWYTKKYPVPFSLSGATIDEVGIIAQDGAYLSPWSFSLPPANHAFDQAIQVNWFTMVCRFVKQHSMHGVYFWGSFMNGNQGNLLSTPEPTLSQMIQPDAQAAIRTCFTH